MGFIKQIIFISKVTSKRLSNIKMMQLSESGMRFSMDKKFSIIIPNYNKEDYVEETLNSIFNQTYKNYEVIVIEVDYLPGTAEVRIERPYVHITFEVLLNLILKEFPV